MTTVAAVPTTTVEVAALIGDLDQWSHNCHAASHRLMTVLHQHGIYSRVARGACRGVFGQHSWLVLDPNCYNPTAPIIDPTLWSYDDTVDGIWFGTLADGRHRPHGYGPHIMQWGCPVGEGGPEIGLAPTSPLSRHAETMLDLFRGHGPLDRAFWSNLANHTPMIGWPAGEIIAAMLDTPELAVLVPIDIEGMVTDRNPNGLYLSSEETS